MLDFGSTSFVFSPQAAKAFSIPVIKRSSPIMTGDLSGNNLRTENMLTLPLEVSFGNHWSSDEVDHAFEVEKTSGEYDAQIPACYFETHKSRGTMTSHVHFPHCEESCCNHGKIHPEYSITYNERIVLSDKAIHIGSVVANNPTIALQLPSCYHEFLLLLDPKEEQKWPDNKRCDHQIEL